MGPKQFKYANKKVQLQKYTTGSKLEQVELNMEQVIKLRKDTHKALYSKMQKRLKAVNMNVGDTSTCSSQDNNIEMMASDKHKPPFQYYNTTSVKQKQPTAVLRSSMHNYGSDAVRIETTQASSNNGQHHNPH